MPGFNSIREMTAAIDAGQSRIYTWRKTPSQVTGSGVWFDLSMSPGNPVAQYYAAAPLAATVMSQSSDGGIFHGAAVSPATMYIRKTLALTPTATAAPLPMIMLDYLLYYPFVDESLVGDVQTMDNTNVLTRSTSGSGVQMVAIVVAAHAVGTGTFFTVNYTNSDGVAGRTSQTVQLNTQFVNGTLITSSSATSLCNGPFIPLQVGDSGVRSVQSVTVTGAGDVGLFSLVLVKPLAQMSIRGIDAPVEVDYFKDFGGGMPVVADNAYLNFICHPVGSLSGAPIHGYMETVWG